MKHHNISLIIPAFNEEKYIGACLKNVFENALGQFSEIIVIDNNSTDRTKEIALQFEGVRVITEPQKGLSYARQCGYENATGNILVYIDADTIIPKRWFSHIEKHFSTSPSLVCLSGPYIFHDASVFHQSITWFYWIVLAMPMYWITGYMATGGNFAITRTALDQMGGFDTSIAFYGEDTNIARRAHKYGTVRFMIPFYIYTSARRLHQKGWLSIGTVYAKNFLSEVFRHRPATNTYEDIR